MFTSLTPRVSTNTYCLARTRLFSRRFENSLGRVTHEREAPTDTIQLVLKKKLCIICWEQLPGTGHCQADVSLGTERGEREKEASAWGRGYIAIDLIDVCIEAIAHDFLTFSRSFVSETSRIDAIIEHQVLSTSSEGCKS